MEIKLGEFSGMCLHATCTAPLSNSTECEIRELKKGAAMKLTCLGVPRRLWCYVLEYESYIRLHTAHDI
ncbi:LOW QUALITY PROTEIN: hypothetical protein ACHAW6_002496 [Cyclotella cf. meneghiniana]